MKKLIAWILLLTFVLALVGCGQSKQASPEGDLNEQFYESWSGTITNIFTEGAGADLAEIIELEIEDHDTMYFTLLEDTEYLKRYFDNGKVAEITKDDLCIGIWVEIDCKSYRDSSYHPITVIKVIEGRD